MTWNAPVTDFKNRDPGSMVAGIMDLRRGLVSVIAPSGDPPRKCPTLWAEGDPAQFLEDGNRYRQYSIGFGVSDVVGKVNISQWQDMVGAHLFDCKKAITEQQVNGHWVLAAWQVDAFEVPDNLRVANHSFGEWNPESKQMKPMKTKSRVVNQPSIRLTTVWCDIFTEAEMDNWGDRTGKPGGQFENGRRPPKVLREYESCKKIIRARIQGGDQGGVVAVLDDTQLALVHKYRTKSHPVPWEAIAGFMELEEEKLRAYYDHKYPAEAPKKGAKDK